MTDAPANRVRFKTALVFGVLLSLLSLGVFGSIAFVYTWIQESFAEALIGFGLVAIFACPVVLLFPLVGAIVSIRQKTLYVFKLWLSATFVSICLNLIIGGIGFGLGTWLAA
ncbi:MAG: hypothetical protein CBD18_06675 [Opitutales bacterium TMED158]|nr:MAG: hypothetical protein CBD18_06675 [Opitutales bacterium TMED158]